MNFDDQYGYMNAGGHRRPPPQIAAPALAWQRGFWRPATNGWTDEVGRKNWHRTIDEILFCLFKELIHRNSGKFVSPILDRSRNGGTIYLFRHKIRLDAQDFSEAVELDDSERPVRYEVFSFRGVIDGVTTTFVSRLHDEYFTLSAYVELGPHNEAQGEIGHVQSHMLRLHELAIKRYQRFNANSHLDGPLVGEEKQLAEQSNSALLRNFQIWVSDICDSAFRAWSPHSKVTLKESGGVFANFLGIALGLKLVPATEGLPTLGTAWFGRPKNKKINIPSQISGSSFKGGDLRVLDAIWPIVRRFHEKRELEEHYGKPEYTVSSVQGGDVLYISSLGRLLLDARHSQKDPVIYTLVVSYPSKWRLGRLVDRLHSLGTLRLAALRDLEKITRASAEINRVAALTSEAQEHDIAPRDIEEIAREYRMIGSDVDVGLEYRIGRSRYYVNSFKNTLKQLRPDEILGYQHYEDFVRRKIYDAFYFIDRVGYRYAELREQVSFLRETSEQLSIQGLRQDMADQVRAVTEHAKTLTRQTEATNHLLNAAELLSVFPLTYYIGSIFYHSKPAMVGWLFPKTLLYGPMGEAFGFLIGLIAAILLAGGAHYFRHRGHRIKGG